jgi:hypothetical protein
MDWTILIYAGLITLGLIGVGSRFIPGWKTDNNIEEIIEVVIKEKTDMDIDLSPDTPDPDDEVQAKKKSKKDV